MLSRRERVMCALNFQPTDQVPKDLGGMASSSISCFAYPHLVHALALPPGRPMIYDQCQMLALPEPDVLDALDCDVATVFFGMTNAYETPRQWKNYDFGGRLRARVRNPGDFVLHPDGVVEQPASKRFMPPEAHVFEIEHGGQNLDFLATGKLPLLDLKRLKEDLKSQLPGSREIRRMREICRRARAASERAIFFSGPGLAEIGIGAHGGIGVFPLICLMNPDYVLEYHEIMTNQTLAKLEMILPEIAPYVDIFALGCDDWGTQQNTIAPPRVFKELFTPFYKRMNARVHQLAPDAKTFIHSCGAIYEVIEEIIESGFDILNPVQWTAGGHSYREWKDKCRGRIALWGGGVNTQATLPLGTLEDVEREVVQIVTYMAEDSGYVFNAIHNLLAEADPRKIIAMYRAAGQSA